MVISRKGVSDVKKYKKGEPITNLDEFAKQEFVIVDNKTYHCGWTQSWQFRMVKEWIDNGVVYKAVKIEKEKE